MNIINIILVCILGAAFLFPIILIPIVILYNFNITRLQKKVRDDTNERTVQTFMAWFIFGPLLNYQKMWKNLIGTFKIIDTSENVSKQTKDKLFEVYLKKGCNPRKVKK